MLLRIDFILHGRIHDRKRYFQIIIKLLTILGFIFLPVAAAGRKPGLDYLFVYAIMYNIRNSKDLSRNKLTIWLAFFPSGYVG
jgi:hypothetical protein